MSKIVVLGGSFNPPTTAHKKLLQTAVNTLKAEAGLFVPSSDAYVKRKMSRQKNYNRVFQEKHRVQMLSTLCDNNIHIDTTELGDDGRGHTYDTLVSIQKKYPDSEIYFIIGDDKLKILPKWHHHDDLLKNFYFGVAVRDIKKGISEVQKTISENARLNAYADHFKIIPTPKDMSDISSSVARIHIKHRNWHMLKDILTPETIDLIRLIVTEQ